MITCVDSNVILDVVTNDLNFADESKRLLAESYDSGSLLICEIVYAEIAPRFSARDKLDRVLEKLGVQVAEGGLDVAYLAGCGWAAYRAAGGTRERLLADFYIGAHASLRGDCLLTRDRGFYKTYFPELRLIGAR